MVEIYDPKNNIKIYSDKVTYKNDELIFSKVTQKQLMMM